MASPGVAHLADNGDGSAPTSDAAPLNQ